MVESGNDYEGTVQFYNRQNRILCLVVAWGVTLLVVNGMGPTMMYSTDPDVRMTWWEVASANIFGMLIAIAASLFGTSRVRLRGRAGEVRNPLYEFCFDASCVKFVRTEQRFPELITCEGYGKEIPLWGLESRTMTGGWNTNSAQEIADWVRYFHEPEAAHSEEERTHICRRIRPPGVATLLLLLAWSLEWAVVLARYPWQWTLGVPIY